MQSIPVPLTGDDSAIKKYAQEVEALKKKVGMADYDDVLNAQMDYAFACSGYDVRKFVTSVFDDLKLPAELEAVARETLSAIEEAEAASGRELDASNEKGWAALTKMIGEIEAKHGLQDKAKVREESIFDMYKKHISSLKTAVEGDVDKARHADKLDHIHPDLGSLKPKLV